MGIYYHLCEYHTHLNKLQAAIIDPKSLIISNLDRRRLVSDKENPAQIN